MNERKHASRVDSLFDEAVELTGREREAFIERQCADDPELARELRSLLEHDAAGDTALRTPVVDFSRSLRALQPGDEINGRYVIEGVLGKGGMGVVYLARQMHPSRPVALKMVRPESIGRDTVRRFEIEAEALARLNHPGIAQIYEAGLFDDGEGGVPFFAMECVGGRSLTDFITEQHPSINVRLQLFARICDAVHHAHQKGIVHRDLKPGNILVVEDESGAAQPKILDFGIARLLDSDVTLVSLRTSTGELMGTIAYMSPEQVDGRPDDIDTRSDVYALGVIFYELLADRLPYDLRDATIAGAARMISEQDPSRLSSVDPAFRGDLETIAAKALEKEPEHRYQSAAALAEDVRRFLDGEPILARPATTIYHLRKFARRNKGLVGSVIALFLILIAGIAGTTWGMVEAQAGRAEAEAAQQAADRQARIAEAVNAFLTDDLLAQADPLNEPDREISLREVLDRAAERIEGAFEQEPLVEAEIRNTVGVTYRNLGKLEEAETHLQRALDLYRSELGDEHRDTLVAMVEVAYLHNQQGKLDEAEQRYLEVLDLQQRVLGEDDPHTLTTMNNLAGVYWQQGRFDEIEPLWLGVLESRRNNPDIEPWRTATTLNNLGALYNYLGRWQDAERMLLDSLEIRKRARGEEHPDTLQSMHNLAWLYGRQKQFEKAIAITRETLEIRRRVLGEEHPDTLFSMSNLAAVLADAGRIEEATQLHAETLEARRRILGERHPHTLNSMQNLAAGYMSQGDFERAEQMFAEVIALYREEMQPDYFETGVALASHGRCLMELGRLDEAEVAMLEGHGILSRALGASNRRTLDALSALIEFYETTGNAEKAEEYAAIRERFTQERLAAEDE